MPASRHTIVFDQSTDERGRKVLITSGEVDLQTAPLLRRYIDRAAEPEEDLVLDLRHVTFMDSPGLGTLIHADRVRREHGGHLIVKDPSGPVRDLFEVVRLANVIEIE